jgi:hypothetical protein
MDTAGADIALAAAGEETIAAAAALSPIAAIMHEAVAAGSMQPQPAEPAPRPRTRALVALRVLVVVQPQRMKQPVTLPRRAVAALVAVQAVAVDAAAAEGTNRDC